MRRENNEGPVVTTYFHESLNSSEKTKVRHHMDEIGFSRSSSEEDIWDRDQAITQSIMQDVFTDASNFPLHSHTYMEIVQYHNPVGIEYLLGNRRYQITDGDIVCVAPNTMHKVIRHDAQPTVRTLIVITKKMLDHMGWPNDRDQFFLVRPKGEQKSRISRLIELIQQEEKTKDKNYEVIVAGSLAVLLGFLTRDPESFIQAEKKKLFEQLISYVEEHLSEPITLKQASKDLFISEKTISREFKKYMDTSFYQYVVSYKMLSAQNLIANGVPIHEVCTKVGFSDYATFFRSFKKYFRMSPKEMKETAKLYP